MPPQLTAADFTAAFPSCDVFLHRYIQQRFSTLTLDAIDDVVAETWLRGWQYRAQYSARNGASIRTWLCSIAANVVYDTARRAQSRIVTIQPLDGVPMPESPPEPGSDTPPVFSAVYVSQLLECCKDNQRTAIMLTHVRGYSMNEAAAITNDGACAAVIKMRVFRGVQRIRRRVLGRRPQQQHVRTLD
jgi:DNA-directed RNA polymerase specialized sigma24 family protein